MIATYLRRISLPVRYCQSLSQRSTSAEGVLPAGERSVQSSLARRINPSVLSTRSTVTFEDRRHFADVGKALSLDPGFDHVHHEGLEPVDVPFLVHLDLTLDRDSRHSTCRFLDEAAAANERVSSA